LKEEWARVLDFRVIGGFGGELPFPAGPGQSESGAKRARYRFLTCSTTLVARRNWVRARRRKISSKSTNPETAASVRTPATPVILNPNATPALFVDDQETRIPMLPGKSDRRSFTGIEDLGFVQVRNGIRKDHEPWWRSGDKGPEWVWSARMTGFLPDGCGNGDGAIKLLQQIQFSEFGQTG
jgi:hypothetical protein